MWSKLYGSFQCAGALLISSNNCTIHVQHCWIGFFPVLNDPLLFSLLIQSQPVSSGFVWWNVYVCYLVCSNVFFILIALFSELWTIFYHQHALTICLIQTIIIFSLGHYYYYLYLFFPILSVFFCCSEPSSP